MTQQRTSRTRTAQRRNDPPETTIPDLLRQAPSEHHDPRIEQLRLAWESRHRYNRQGSTCYWTLPMNGDALAREPQRLVLRTEAELEGHAGAWCNLSSWTSVGWTPVATLCGAELGGAATLEALHRAALDVAARLWVP